MARIRINRYLASTGELSRRKADELVLAGRVAVNGTAAVPGTTVEPEKDRVTIDGNPVYPLKKLYLALYKPRNVLTTMHDPQGRPTVKAHIPPKYRGVFPVGRLDFDAEGLLFLTNDGDLAQRLHHPSFGVPKTYLVKVIPRVMPEHIERMQRGVELDGVMTLPAEVEVVRRHDRGATLRIVLRQGLKNQIKRMAQAVGLEVTSIKRIAVGPVSLKGISPGEVRELKPFEVRDLRKLLK
ncbi:MAG: pseudouridine synthase [Desulfomonilia bacterium]|jgi:23S rRNA pseudouridine2605 synthase